MSKSLDDIWMGDSSERMAEALTLQHFINSEIAARRARRREQSYVLAIDAAYGEGKTWFLQRFRRQLALKHPVAFIDAWIDEANNEPLVAFMGAIEEALQPHLSKRKKIREKFATFKRASLPALGRIATGAATKASQKYFGETIGDDLDKMFAGTDQGSVSSDDGHLAEGVEGLIDQAGKEIASVVDRRGAAALAAYRKQKQSREFFRNNMHELIKVIDSNGGELETPLFIVVDELDRCRPDYAIRLLEEIKHFFDVPGVAFVIALHGDQLTKSINAVYGSEFDSAAYLRRFFSHRYELRRLSVAEIVAQEYSGSECDDTKFFVPQIIESGKASTPTAPDFIGRVLDALKVTPREAFPVMDALRMFHDQWIHKIQIELVALLPMLVNMVRGQSLLTTPKHSEGLNIFTYRLGDGNGRRVPVPFHETVSNIFSHVGNPLPNLAANGESLRLGYAGERFAEEYRIEHGNSSLVDDPPHSIIRSYADVVRLVERFTDDVANDYLSAEADE